MKNPEVAVVVRLIVCGQNNVLIGSDVEIFNNVHILFLLDLFYTIRLG